MESNTSLIQAKMSKVESSLEDLKREISKCSKNLEKLQAGAGFLVEKLNEISQPATYLHEFMGVHKFVLKYISFLTEINCKFEVMEILDLDNGSVQTIQNHLNNAYQAFEKSAQPKLSIALGESFEFLENIEGSSPNISNEEKPKPEAESLEGIKGANVEIVVENKKVEFVEVEGYYLEIGLPQLPEGLECGYDVNVKHIVSPSEFYVHFTETRFNVLPKLEEELKAIDLRYREKKEKTAKHFEASRALLSGKQVFGLYYSEPDQMWYRVTVSDWFLTRETEMITVFFLDHGDYKEINFEDLLPMRKSLTKYPALAQRCHLSGVGPPDEDLGRELKWGGNVKNEMIKLLINAGSVEIHVAGRDDFHPPTSLPVSLWTASGRFTCINKVLIQKKLARELKPSKDENTLMNNWKKMEEDFESYLNPYEIEAYRTASDQAHSDWKLPSTVDRKWKCFKANKCKKAHSAYNPFGCSGTEDVYRNAFNDMIPPPVDSIIRVIVTSVSSVAKFYCITGKKEDEDSLSELVDSINDLSDEDGGLKKLFIPPAIGQIVLAKYSRDRCWYRAKVLESLPEADEFLVMFVDYGNEETVPFANIREIEARFLQLPFQGIQCFIYGVSENPDAAQDEVAKYLKEKLHDQEVKIEVLSHFPGSEVTLLVKVYDLCGNDIGNEIINRRYGLEKDDIILDAEGFGLPG